MLLLDTHVWVWAPEFPDQLTYLAQPGLLVRQPLDSEGELLDRGIQPVHFADAVDWALAKWVVGAPRWRGTRPRRQQLLRTAYVRTDGY